LVRRIFLKLSLHRNLNKRIKQNTLLEHTNLQFKKKYKENIIQELQLFRDDNSNLQIINCRLFNFYVQQNTIIDKLCLLCAELVILVVSIFTIAEYNL